MKFSQDDNLANFLVTAYSPGKIYINQTEYTNNIVLSSTRGVSSLDCATIEQLSLDILTPLLMEQPEILLIGTGEQMKFINPQLAAYMQSQLIGVENMDTKAACRTYNLLANEDRKVIALLFIELSAV